MNKVEKADHAKDFNPEAEYRKLVEKYAQNGELKKVAVVVLTEKRKLLGITDTKAEEIETEVLAPVHKHLADLQSYKQYFAEEVEQKYPLDEHTLNILKDYQDVLGLRDEDVASIELEITSIKKTEYQKQLQKQKQKQEYENNLQRYEQELTKAVQVQYPLDEYVYNGLKTFQHFLKLRDEDIALIEQRILAPKQAEYEHQQQELEKLHQEQPRNFDNSFLLDKVRGNDLRLDLKLDFREAIFGGEKEFCISHLKPCEVCKGSGRKYTSLSRITYHGKCDFCDGKGLNTVTSKLKIAIPAGVDNGIRLRVAQEGDAGQGGGNPGDLYIYLFVNEDKELKRNDINILSEIIIDRQQALSGCRLEVNTVDGWSSGTYHSA